MEEFFLADERCQFWQMSDVWVQSPDKCIKIDNILLTLTSLYNNRRYIPKRNLLLRLVQEVLYFGCISCTKVLLQQTHKNRQYIPKWNLLSKLVNLSVSFLLNIPFRRCHILVVVLVAEFPLFSWDVGPWWISHIIFQYTNNVIIHHPVIKTIIPMKNISWDLSISFLFNVPFRKCYILVVFLVPKFFFDKHIKIDNIFQNGIYYWNLSVSFLY
jgi:hypothetical protein